MVIDSAATVASSNVQWFDLIVDKRLMDYNFEGYKLSLNSFANYKLDLDESIKPDTYNYVNSDESKQKVLIFQHLKLFSFQNLLITNHYDNSNIYYFDQNGRLVKLLYNSPLLTRIPCVVPTSLQLRTNNVRNLERANLSMKFTSESTAIVYDGYDTILFCTILNKSQNPLEVENWHIEHEWQASSDHKCYASDLRDARQIGSKTDVLLVNVHEQMVENQQKFDTLINWLTFEQGVLKRHRQLNCANTIPDFVELEETGECVLIAGENFIKITYDSDRPIQEASQQSEQDVVMREPVKSETMNKQSAEEQGMSEEKSHWAEVKNYINLDQQLEECDEVINQDVNVNESNESMLMLKRIDGNTHEETHKCNISDNKFLFDAKIDARKCSAICLRHDVDGVLWQAHQQTSSTTKWLTHEFTFMAFGYVQASKTQKKYCGTSPNCSYVCIVDSSKHVYIYKQEKMENQLKNRKSGKLITNIAQQYLISLDSEKEIHGFYCANDYLILLLKDTCYIYRINSLE